MKSPLLRRIILTLACFAAGWLAASAAWPEIAASGTARTIPLTSTKKRPVTELDDLINAVHRAGGPGAQMKAALALAASLSPADYQRTLERVRFLPAAAQKFFNRAVLRRWIEIDPATAVKWCVGNADTCLTDAIRQWTERDPAAARAFISTLPPQHHRNAVCGCAEALAATDPAAAIAFLTRFGTDNYAMRGALRKLAQRDPKWLLESSESLPVFLRGEARGAAISAMGENDLAAAVAWARQQPDQRALLERLLGGTKDRRAALSVITSLPQHQQQSLLDSCASALSWKDPKGMLALLRDTPGFSERAVKPLMNAAVQYFAAKDPAAAAEHLQAEFPERVEMWSRALALAWAGKDLSAAKAWAATLPDGEARRVANESIEQIDSRQAVQTAGTPLVRRLAKGDANHRYVNRGAVLSLSPAERAGVLQEIGEAKQPDHNVSNILKGMQQFYPADYAGWLASQPEQASQTQDFAREWAGEEPQAAAAWVLKLPAGETKNTAAGYIAGQWAALDPGAARQWVQSLPAGPERDRALQALEPPAAPP